MGYKLSINEAVVRNYIVKSKQNGKNSFAGYLTLPKCLVGKRVNLKLVV